MVVNTDKLLFKKGEPLSVGGLRGFWLLVAALAPVTLPISHSGLELAAAGAWIAAAA